MADLQPGRWYRLIGGDRVRIDAVDAEAGMVTVTDTRGQTQRLTRSAFVGALAEAGGDLGAADLPEPRHPAPATIDPAATDLDLDFDLDAIDDRLSALRAGGGNDAPPSPALDPLLQELSELDQMLDGASAAADPKPETAAAPAPALSLEKPVEKPVEAWPEAQSEAPEETTAAAPLDPPARPPAQDQDVAAASASAGTASTAPEIAAPRGSEAMPAAPVTDVPDTRPRTRGEGITAARDGAARGRRPAATEPPRATLNTPRPQADPVPGTTGELDFGEVPDEAVPGLGLSPLALGMLLGMIVLTGLAGGLVLQSRIDALDEQFVQVDQRLQVLMGDVRRQGETLRGLVANPASSQAPSTPGEAAAPAGVASLEQGLAAQRQQVETVAQAVARHDAQLAELERRSARAEQRAAPAPAHQQAPVATPGGYVVVLASLPLRDQALQQLDLLRAKGLKAVLREAQVNGRTWYRVQTEGFADREAADRYAREAATRHGVDGVWVAAPGG